MTKAAYVGVNGVARKIKKGYVGISGVARAVKKAYIGVGGVARPFWNSEGLSYYGQVTPLPEAMAYIGSASSDSYAIFYGGFNDFSSSFCDASVAYSSNLLQITLPGDYTYPATGTSLGDYSFFGGFYYLRTMGESTTKVIVYTPSLTVTSVSLSDARGNLAAISIGNYAIFAGGEISSRHVVLDPYIDTVDAFTASLTRTTPTTLSEARSALAASKTKSFALFGGGTNSQVSSVVDAYSSNLVHTTTALNTPRSFLQGGNVGGYAVFAGGLSELYSDALSSVETFTDSLVLGTATSLTSASYNFSSASLEKYAVFAGGQQSGNSYNSFVNAYDSNLTKIDAPELAEARAYLAGASVSNNLLFAGGINSTNCFDLVEVYSVS